MRFKASTPMSEIMEYTRETPGEELSVKYYRRVYFLDRRFTNPDGSYVICVSKDGAGWARPEYSEFINSCRTEVVSDVLKKANAKTAK